MMASNRLVLRWLKTVVVSVQGKGRPWADVRWGPGRRTRVNRCGSVEMLGWHQNWGLKVPWDESGGVSVLLVRRCSA